MGAVRDANQGHEWEETPAIFDYQGDIVRHNLSWANLSLMGQRPPGSDGRRRPGQR